MPILRKSLGTGPDFKRASTPVLAVALLLLSGCAMDLGLKPLTTEDRVHLRQGQKLVVVGYPYGFSYTPRVSYGPALGPLGGVIDRSIRRSKDSEFMQSPVDPLVEVRDALRQVRLR